MSVNPGFGGQQFIPHTVEKTQQLKALLTQYKSTAQIQIDGGVTLDNCKALIDAGADILVAGSAIFKSPNPLLTIQKMAGRS
jgi:ribulose-phosphate 3-epimerase